MKHTATFTLDLPHAVLEGLPNPVFVKTAQLDLCWVNPAFETFFDVTGPEVMSTDGMRLIPARRAADHAGSDQHVLQTGLAQDCYQTVFTAQGHPKEAMIRKSRLQLPDGQSLLVGVIHDVSDVMRANALLREDRTHLTEHAERLRNIADRDPLTGAFTRRALFERVSQLGGTAYGLLLIDIDHFKSINDTYGHSTGDEALSHFCRVARGCLRSDDVFARVGGEEFAVVLPCRDQDHLAAIAERICEEIRRNPLKVPGDKLKMTVSIGAVAVPGADTRPPGVFEAALETADKRMYQAKTTGRDRVVVTS